MDIERYVSGEAVLARPPSRFYKARKLIGRNKLLSSSLAAFIILLAASLLVAVRLLAMEKRTREQLQHQNDLYRLENSAFANAHNPPEAERHFEQSFELRHQFFGDAPPTQVAEMYYDVMRSQNKLKEASNVLVPFMTASPGEDYKFLFGNMASDLATEGYFKEALVDARILVKSRPDFPQGYHILAPLLVASDDIETYSRLTPQIIEQCGGVQDPNTADQMAKDCLILPAPATDLGPVGALADLAVDRGSNNGSFPFFQCCKALAEYRKEHFAEAIKWAGSAVKDPFPYSRAEGYAILAMAQFQTGQTNQAQASLANCNDVIEKKFPKFKSGNLGHDWRDWIIAHALQIQATQLIDGKPSSGTFIQNVSN